MIPTAALIILALSLVVALYGRNRKFGFWGYFFASLLLTPFVGLLLVLAGEEKENVDDKKDK